jgi:hypothetical protein
MSPSASQAPFLLPQPLAGYVNGAATAAAFNGPYGVAVGSLDGSGEQTAYVADTGNNLIRAISPSGTVSTLAGGLGGTGTGVADGIGTNAAFNSPLGVTIYAGTLFVSEATRIRAVSAGGSVSVAAGGNVSGTEFGYADGTGTNALFYFPIGMAGNTNPNAASPTLFIAEVFSSAIRAFDLVSLAVTTVAGGSPGYANGVGLAAAFSFPFGLAFDGVNTLYIADSANNAIRAMAVDTAAVTTFAGFNCSIQNNGCMSAPYADGVGANASFSGPAGLAFLPSANPSTGAGTLYVTTTGDSSTIRAITVPVSGALFGVTTTLAGNSAYNNNYYANGVGTNALFSYPIGVATISGSNALLVADSSNNVIRQIAVSGATGSVVTFAGGGVFSPSPAPSVDATSSVSPSLSVTPAQSPSASATLSQSPSASASSSRSVSNTPSTSVSPAVTVTTGLSVTQTPSVSASVTVSLSVLASVSVSPSVSPSVMASPSVSASVTATAISPSVSPSNSASRSLTPSRTSSPSPSPSGGTTSLLSSAVVFQLPASATRAEACTGDAVRATFNAVLAAAQTASTAASIPTSAWLSLTSPAFCNVTSNATSSSRRARQLQTTTYYVVIAVPVYLPESASSVLVNVYSSISALTGTSFTAAVQALANALGVPLSSISFSDINVASTCTSGSACATIVSPTPTVPATPTTASAAAAGSGLTSSQQVGLGVGIALPLAAIVLVVVFLSRGMATPPAPVNTAKAAAGAPSAAAPAAPAAAPAAAAGAPAAAPAAAPVAAV